MSKDKLVPYEMYVIIPLFDGDTRLLNLFLRKCEYILDKYKSESDEEYLMHVLTSRLRNDAAAIVSECENIKTWAQLKELLIQHFGDPRTEECLAIVLETSQIKSGETYTEFYRRIQSVRSTLMSKVNQITDVNMRNSKISFYDNLAFQVFLYNLPENIVAVVRMKAPKSLEETFAIVLQEETFHEHYKMRGHIYPNASRVIPNIRPIPTSVFHGMGRNPMHSQPSVFGSAAPGLFGSSSVSFPSQGLSAPAAVGLSTQNDHPPPMGGSMPNFGNLPTLNTSDDKEPPTTTS